MDKTTDGKGYRMFMTKGIPEYIRSDNGSEFTTEKVKEWLTKLGVKTLFIEPGNPCENGYIESFNGILRIALLNVETFDTLYETKIIIKNGG
jgi:putative transposase